MKAKYIFGDSKKVIREDWGTLQWLAEGEHQDSEVMTVGNVTFKPGRSNPCHFHPNCEEILYVIKGELEHTIDDKSTVRLSPGDVIVVPQGLKHYAKNVGDTEASVLVSFNNAHRETIGE